MALQEEVGTMEAMMEAMASASLEAINEDACGWIKGLGNNRVGRLLSNHLACIALETKNRTNDCAATEANGNERIFVHAMARSLMRQQPLPCGLTNPPPRYIALLNLSGERSLVYSNNPALIRCLCTNSSWLRGSALCDALTAFEAFPTNSAGRFVLLTYSLPWQAGTDAAFWHLSACEMSAAQEGVGWSLRDRILQFSSRSAAPHKGKSVIDGFDLFIPIRGPDQPSLPMVADKQLADFAESYSATNLDLSGDAACQQQADKPEKKVAQLKELVQILQLERARDQKELREEKERVRALKTTHKHELKGRDDKLKATQEEKKRALESQQNTAKDMLALSRQQNDAFSAEIVEMRQAASKMSTEHQRSVKAHDKLVEKHKEMQRRSEAKDALHNAALSKHVATIARLEGRVASSDERFASAKDELCKAHAAAIAKLRREHEEAIDRLTGALESKKRIINQLSENNDRKDVEKASLQTHTDEQAVRIRDLEASLAETEKECRRLNAELTKKPKARSKHASTSPSRNASTATHHCASTQTTAPPASPPPPEPVPVPVPAPASAPEPAPALEKALVPAMGTQVVAEVAPSAMVPLSYQAAINMLQELVVNTGHGNAQPTTTHLPPQAIPNGYMRPLPYPHFTPANAYHQSASAHFHPQQHPSHYVPANIYARPLPQQY